MTTTNVPSYTVFAGTAGRCGLAVHTTQLVRGLANAGHAVTLVAFEHDYFTDWLSDSSVRVIHLPIPESPLPWCTYQAWSHALEGLPGERAILARGIGGATSLPILLALRRYFQRVYTIEHALADLPQIAWGRSPRRRSVFHFVRNQLACRLVDRAIAVSEATRQSVIKEFNFLPSRIHTCLNWVDTDQFRPDPVGREKIRSALNITKDCLLVGFVGRLAREKRPGLLIRGFSEFLRRARKPAKLVVIGVGPLEDELHRLAKNLQIGDAVHFTGWIENPAPWQSAMDIQVLPSFSEPFGLSGIEAMACGTIYLTHQGGGSGEFVRHGENGFITPLDEPAQIAEWLSHIESLTDSDRKRIKVVARETTIRGFSVNVGLARLLETLDAPVAAAYAHTRGLTARTAATQYAEEER